MKQGRSDIMLSVVLLLAVLSAAAAQQRPNYTHTAVLDTNNTFVVSWLPSGTGPNDYITFECVCRTQGWLGMGFSPDGGMAGADIVIAWIDQTGNPQISDRHGPANGNGYPPPDDVQNYELISGQKNQTHITVTFRRKLSTCDPNDWTITADTTRMIWAKNDQVPSSAQDIQIHTAQGEKSVQLLTNQTDSGLSKIIADPSVTTLDFGVDSVPIPSDQVTLYWCKIVQMPVSTKKQIIATEMMIQPGNENIVHHLILNGCDDNDMTDWLNKPGPCYNDTAIFTPMQKCNSLMGAWAVGGGPFVYPSNMGAPIFENNTNNQRFAMVEMHYNNAELTPGLTDSSFYRMYLTTNFRPVETGRFSMGVPVLPTEILIPPQQPSFTIYSYCPSSCTSRLQQPMNIFSGLLHTHLLGIAVRLRVIRKGIELVPVMKDDHYNFNYQNPILLSNPLVVQPGDDLIVECVYDSSASNKPTYGGFSTAQEMCLTMFEYYPKRNITSEACQSFIDQTSQLKLLGAKSVYLGPNGGFDFHPVTVINQNNQNRSLLDFYNSDINWTNATANLLQAFKKNPPQTVLCDLQLKPSDPNFSNDTGIMKMTQAIPITQPYVATNTCSLTSSTMNPMSQGNTNNNNNGNGNNNNGNNGNNNANNNNYNNGNNGNSNNYNNVPVWNPSSSGSSYNDNANSNTNNNNVNSNTNNNGNTMNNNGNSNSNDPTADLMQQIGRLFTWVLQKATNQS